MPAITVARSPTASTAAAYSSRRSSSVRVGDSPVVPVTTSPSEPLSTRCRASSPEPVVVDRAVLPERRHDRRQDLAEHARIVGTVHEGDCPQARSSLRSRVRPAGSDPKSGSSPTVRPGGSDGSRSSASRTPGTNASRESVSWRIVSSSPGPPSSTSWCATSPGSRTEWIAGSPPIAAAVAFAVPDGASTFVSWWSSTISRAGSAAAASRSEAHHQHGAEREVRRDEDGDAAPRGPARPRRSRSAPVVPTTTARPRRAPRRRSRPQRPGRVKSTIASASPSPSTQVVPGRARAPARAPSRPCPREPLSRITLTPRPPARGGCARPPPRNRSSLGPMPAAESRAGLEQHAGQLGERRRLDGVDLGDDPVERRAARCR